MNVSHRITRLVLIGLGLSNPPKEVTVDTPAPAKHKATDGASASGQSHNHAIRVPR